MKRLVLGMALLFAAVAYSNLAQSAPASELPDIETVLRAQVAGCTQSEGARRSGGGGALNGRSP